MTVGMNRLNSLFRDFKVAEDVGKMMELRRFEREFEVFGLAFFQGCQCHYLSSGDPEKLYMIRDRLALEGSFPSSVHVFRDRMLVPSGWDDEMEREVKIRQCRNLKESLPSSYWEDIVKIAPDGGNASADELIRESWSAIEGTFDEARIDVFELLVDQVFLRGNLSTDGFNAVKGMINEERQGLLDDAPESDLFSKMLYGYAYQSPDGRICTVVNANRWTLEESRDLAIEKSMVLVSSIYGRKVWYNYDRTLVAACSEFKFILERLFCSDYFELLGEICALTPVVDEEAFFASLGKLKARGMSFAVKSFMQQGRLWGLDPARFD